MTLEVANQVPVATDSVKPRSKRWIVILVIVVVAVLVGGVAVLARQGVVRVPGITKDATKKVVSMPQNLALGDLGAGVFVGTVVATAISSTQGEATENLTVSGAFDFTDLTHPSFRGDFAPAQAKSNQGVVGSFIKVGKDLFAKVSLPSISIILPAGMKDTWINLTPGTTDTNHLTRNQNLYKTVTESSVLAVDAALSDELVGSTETSVYQFHVSPDAVTAAATAYRENNEQRKLSDVEKATLSDTIHRITVDGGKIWIGKSDHKLHRISFTATMTGSSADKFTGHYVVDLTFDYQSATITAPANAKTLQQVFGPNMATYLTNLFYSTLGTLFADGLDISPEIQSLPGSKIDSDNDNLSDTLESVYGTDPKNPDSDGDGFKDGGEVSAGYNPKGTGTLIHAAQ